MQYVSYVYAFIYGQIIRAGTRASYVYNQQEGRILYRERDDDDELFAPSSFFSGLTKYNDDDDPATRSTIDQKGPSGVGTRKRSFDDYSFE